MNTDLPATTPTSGTVAGLLSLLAQVLDPSSADVPQAATDAPELDRSDLAAALEHVVRGWMSVRHDGHGWLLVQFSPEANRSDRVEKPEHEPVEPTPITAARASSAAPRFGSVEQKVASLTDREREVLCLVAAGATNCAIAARLFISPKTASVHVSHILTKLGAATRTEAAAYAHAAGLVQPWGSMDLEGLGLGLEERALVGA
jgi:DNA-binding NarL/FixJ family response regulator